MARCWLCCLLIAASCQWWLHAASAASLPAPFAVRYPRRMQQSNAYLPPYTGENFGDRVVPTQNVDHFQTSPQLSTASSRKASSSSHYKAYTSYAPPPSGSGAGTAAITTFQYSAPQAAGVVPLPSFIPKSVIEDLKPASTAATNQQPQQPQQQHEHEQQTSPFGLIIEPQEEDDLEEEVEELPVSMYLTASQNQTLQAARILASTLLEANGDPPLAPLNGLQLFNPPHLQHPHNLNTTDVVIVKAQKNAYIIPTQLRKDGRNSLDARGLYQMRGRLEKAYTINQFIFIIKPEKINFLNKLV